MPWTPESRYRPLCSERCKQMDLGAWAAERYRIGGEQNDSLEPGGTPDTDSGELH